MAGADNSQRRGSREPRRNLRFRLACARCQRRKIRCDGNVPTCNNCKKASVECTDGESVRLGDIPRACVDCQHLIAEDQTLTCCSQISRLRHRVQWLESIIKTRCPDVDLSRGPESADVDDNAITLLDGVDSSGIDMEEGMSIDRSSTCTSQPPSAFFRAPKPSSSAPGIAPRQLEQHSSGLLSHEIGLVSLNGSQDPRYIGPSSGYFLARVMLATNRREDDSWRSKSFPAPGQALSNDLIEALQGPLPLPPDRQAQLLCEQYFEVIHPQFPILHRPTFMAKLSQVLITSDPEPEDAFQVFMVLALGSIIASHRRHVRLPGESYCLSALRYLDRLNVENSLQGLQCLLLLFLFTMHCSNMKLNVWYLNYQCIAAVLDLGLQRNITTKSGITKLEQEMRTRIFWVVIMLDRRVATMMGRPIGLRDEACDLRNLDDDSLASSDGMAQSPPSQTPGTMEFSIQMFKLAKLNSEIKYVANSIVRDTPGYAYPNVIDYHDWQRSMLERLDEWSAKCPAEDVSNGYIHTVCQIQYQSLKMVLLRPSPAIPNPPHESLRRCHEAAYQNLRLIGNLYKINMLIHSWETFYSLVLSAITRMYCIKTVPDLARETDAETLLADLGDCLSILSATGEHWPGAKRCRDILDDLGRALVKWLKESRSSGSLQTTSGLQTDGPTVVPANAPEAQPFEGNLHWNDSNGQPLTSLTPVPDGHQVIIPPDMPNLPFFAQDPFEPFSGAGWSALPAESENMDAIIRSLFDDFIPGSGDYIQGQ